jgi:two-component system chemotaxis response regulator CheB
MMAIEIVALGASWGGLHAIETVLGALPVGFHAAVVIAQHRQIDGNDGMLEQLLDARCALTVSEAEDKQQLAPGRVLVAPADYHMLVEPGSVSLSVDDPLHYSRPSIDILLGSAADAYGERAAGVVLTGANADGALGLARIAARGGATIVQDPATAERSEMPAAAQWSTPEALVLALERIGPALVELVQGREPIT